eukprot:Gb_11112 [translate_table: standard]
MLLEVVVMKVGFVVDVEALVVYSKVTTIPMDRGEGVEKIGLANCGKRDGRGVAGGGETDITGDTTGVKGTCREEDDRTKVEGDHIGCRLQGNNREEQKCKTEDKSKEQGIEGGRKVNRNDGHNDR